MIGAVLLLCAAALLGAPRLLVRTTRLRRSPRAALLLWQAISLSTVLCLLAAGPLAVLHVRSQPAGPVQLVLTGVAVVASVVVLVRLVRRGHQIGRRIRAARTEHRDLVDLVGRHEDQRTRVLPSTRVSAYCLPGLGSRLVITEAALTDLPEDELDAVVAHERAHLRERHDLILEFFTVLHTATPRALRADAALREVALLVEVLADRAARATTGEVALGRALVALAEAAATHQLAPGASAGAGAAATRVRLLADNDPAPWQTGVLYVACVLVLLGPPALAALVAGATI